MRRKDITVLSRAYLESKKGRKMCNRRFRTRHFAPYRENFDPPPRFIASRRFLYPTYKGKGENFIAKNRTENVMMYFISWGEARNKNSLIYY